MEVPNPSGLRGEVDIGIGWDRGEDIEGEGARLATDDGYDSVRSKVLLLVSLFLNRLRREYLVVSFLVLPFGELRSSAPVPADLGRRGLENPLVEVA